MTASSSCAVMQIFVKAQSGKVMNIAVDSNDTVKSVKHTIQVKDSVPVNRQTLLHEGRELEDGRRLQDYGIVQSRPYWMEEQNLKTREARKTNCRPSSCTSLVAQAQFDQSSDHLLQ